MTSRDGSLLQLADRLWNGEIDTAQRHPFSFAGEAEEISDATFFVASFANSIAFRTGEGLLLVDTGSPFTGAEIRRTIRTWSNDPVTRIVYTHGHIDHVMGAHLYDEEAEESGAPAPRVYGHEAVGNRFERYVLTAGYNATINARQFGLPELRWPVDYRYPDETYRDELTLEVGDVSFRLRHARGETDDHTFVWVPERKVLACGDFFIWASPNAGNPQKAQRYPREWASALRDMAGLGAEILLPGHGLPVVGTDRVKACLIDSAILLEAIVEQTLSLMNDGAALDRILNEVEVPADLLEKPYLKPVYDEPAFIVRNIWRLYGGWYDGAPHRLKPATPRAVAAEVAELSGGASRLAERASLLVERGDLAVACHLIDLAIHAAPDDPQIASIRRTVYERRAESEISTMSKGIFSAAASDP